MYFCDLQVILAKGYISSIDLDDHCIVCNILDLCLLYLFQIPNLFRTFFGYKPSSGRRENWRWTDTGIFRWYVFYFWSVKSVAPLETRSGRGHNFLNHFGLGWSCWPKWFGWYRYPVDVIPLLFLCGFKRLSKQFNTGIKFYLRRFLYG